MVRPPPHARVGKRRVANPPQDAILPYISRPPKCFLESLTQARACDAFRSPAGETH